MFLTDFRAQCAKKATAFIRGWAHPDSPDDTLDKLAGSGPRKSNVRTVQNSVVDNSRLFEYSYEMPLGKSSYRVKVPDGWAVTGYSGTLLLDPQTNDLVQMLVRTDELPSASSACQATSEVTYRRTSIHQRMVLVPHETKLSTITATGDESISQTSYANCREYSSTVKMIFGEETLSAGPTAVSKPAMDPPAALPAGLRFNAHITTPLETETAAAGDPIEAVLTNPMRDKKKQIIAPAGAPLNGRLRMVRFWSDPFNSLQIAVQFESIEIGGRKVPLNAILYAPVYPLFMGASRYRMRFLTAGDSFIGGMFFLNEGHLRAKQLDSEWITMAPAERKDKK